MFDLSSLGSSEKVMLGALALAIVLGLLYAVGLVSWVLARVFAFLNGLVELGFWIWERLLAGIPWPLLGILIIGVHVVLYYHSGPLVTLLLGFLLLHVGFVCCLAYIAVDQERLDVARGYKALHNPAKGQQLALRLTVYGSRVDLPLLLVATIACVSGFALLNQGLSESVGSNWYAPGHHTHYKRLTDEELALERQQHTPPGYADFLVYSLLNLASAFDFIDVINLTGVSRISYVHPNRWPASLMLVMFRLFFTAVVLQQILSFFGKMRLIQESVRDFWSPHEPIQRRAGENLAQLGVRAADNLLHSTELIEYITPEQRDLLLRIITSVGPATIPLLVERLEHPRPIVREIAMAGLGRLRALECLQRLVRFREDTQEGVRLSLVEALDMIADEGPASVRKRYRLLRRRRRSNAQGTNTGWWSRRREAAEPEVDPVELTVETLRQLLDDPIRAVRLSAIRLLGRLGPEAQPAAQELARQTQDPEETVREEAVRALGSLAGPVDVAIPALMTLLREEQVPHVTVAALHALGEFGSEAAPAAPLLTALVQNREEEIRTAAAEALRRIGPLDASVIPALVAGLRNPDNQVRIQAAEALGTIGPSAAEAVPALIAALHDPNDGVRVQVARALGGLGDSAVTALPALAQALRDKDSNVAAAAAAALGDIGPAASAALASLLKASNHSNPVVRTHVAEALARVEDEPASVLPCLIEMTQDSDAEVRCAALGGLSGKTGVGPIRYEIFWTALGDESPDVRAIAVAELPELGLTEAELIERLLLAVDDVSDVVQIQAVEALAELPHVPDTVIERLCRLLTEDSVTLQLVTLRGLCHFGPRAAAVVPTLLQILQRAGTEVRAEVLHAASRIAPQETLSLFLAGLHDNDVEVRRHASLGLLRCEQIPEEQLGNLAEALKDPSEQVRGNVVRLCLEKNLIRPEMYPLLAACLSEPDDTLRLNALRGLRGAPFDLIQEVVPRLLTDASNPIRLLAAVRVLQREPGHEEARRLVRELVQNHKPEEKAIVEDALDQLGPLREEIVGNT